MKKQTQKNPVKMLKTLHLQVNPIQSWNKKKQMRGSSSSNPELVLKPEISTDIKKFKQELLKGEK